MKRAKRPFKRNAATRERRRLGLLTCVWKRHSLTALVLDYYAALRASTADRIDWTMVAVGSEGATSRNLAEGRGFTYVEHANEPLGAKWNAGLRPLQQVRPEAVIIVGSDDLVPAAAMEHYLRALDEGARFIGFTDMFFYDAPTHRMLYWPGYQGARAGETVGCGRCVHREFLDEVGWQLWHDERNSGLDRSMMERFAALSPGSMTSAHRLLSGRDLGVALIDIKSDTNMWSFDQTAAAPGTLLVDPEPVWQASYTPELFAAVRGLNAAQTDDVAELIEAGEEAFARHDLKTALAHFERATLIAPYSPLAHNDLGATLHALGDYAEAERSLLRAAILSDDAGPALENLAAVADERDPAMASVYRRRARGEPTEQARLERSTDDVPRPRMLFLSGPHDHLDPIWQIGLVQPVLQLLHAHFAVDVVPGDVDYEAVVARWQPDVVLFDSGVDALGRGMSAHSRTNTHPDVPKIGLMRADFHAPMRTDIYGRMARFGVEAIFSPCFSAEGAPSTWDIPFFYIPRWLDPELFRDYAEEKSITCAMLGAGFLATEYYPWRRRIAPRIMEKFPFVHADRPVNGRHALVGERFARMLNRSVFGLTCGGATQVLVSKFLEIPGTRSCLVCEDIPVVRAVGFEDMKSAVFADADTIVDKLTWLLEHPDELDRITDAGYRLAHDHHGPRARRQIIDWYHLRKAAGTGGRIHQPDLMGPLRPVGADEVPRWPPFQRTPVLRELHDGFERLEQGIADGTTEARFANVLRTYPYMAEANVGLAYAAIVRRDFDRAAHFAARNLNYVAARGGLLQDPFDLALLIVAMIGCGNLETAASIAARHPDIRHPTLDAARTLVAERCPQVKSTAPFAFDPDGPGRAAASIHPFRPRTCRDWLTFFRACLDGISTKMRQTP